MTVLDCLIDQRLYIGLLDAKQRVQFLVCIVLESNLQRMLILKKLVFRTIGFLGADIRNLVNEVAIMMEEVASDLHVVSKLDYDEDMVWRLKRRKYERLRKHKEEKRAELRKQEAAEAQHYLQGQVIGIHSAIELEKKLNAASKSSRLTILYFTAAWCGLYQYISTVYTNLAGKYPKVVFLKVDIDEAADVAGRWNVTSVLTFFFIKNGREVDSVVGADNIALERKIAQHAILL
ncbi:hypothetical protein HN51_031486 [Arachis hypogaea]